MAVSRGDSSARSHIRCASRAFIAIRASVRTCLPASRAASVTGQCRYGQAPITTASTSGIRDQIFPVAVHLRNVEVARDAGRRLARAVADRDHLHTRQALEAGQVPRPRDLSRPDDPDANLARAHRSPHNRCISAHARCLVSCPNPLDSTRFDSRKRPDSLGGGGLSTAHDPRNDPRRLAARSIGEAPPPHRTGRSLAIPGPLLDRHTGGRVRRDNAGPPIRVTPRTHRSKIIAGIVAEIQRLRRR